MNQPRMVDPLSTTSLRLDVTSLGNTLGTATGFTVEHRGRPFLITNWHAVRGRNADTGELLNATGAIPWELRMFCHAEPLGAYVAHVEPLYEPDGQTPRWIEHPRGQAVDVVALPLHLAGPARIHPLDLELANTDVAVQAAMPVSIIGYPFGLATGGAWPIWKTGHIASDPDLDYAGQPVFLIDATTREGMSGSPVVRRAHGGYRTTTGDYAIGIDGTRFLGVYSGRIHGESEIGRVWRPFLVNEILGRVP